MYTKIIQEIAKEAAKAGRLPPATKGFLDKVWPSFVGPQLAILTEPVQLDGETLEIAVRHKELLKEWRDHPWPLLKRLQERSPWAITSLRFVYDEGAGLEVSIPELQTNPVGKQRRKEAPSFPPGIDTELAAILTSIQSNFDPS